MVSNDKNGGVILLMDKLTKEILITDLYNENERDGKWQEWLSTAIERFKKSPRKDSNITIQDFHIGNIRHLENRTDKQVAFLLQNLSPERELKIMDAVFAMRKNKDLPDIDRIEDIIRSNKEEYEQYQNRYRPLVSLMTATNGFIKDQNTQFSSNTPHSERIFRLKGEYSFLGKERIRTSEDVAWIFRSLEQKGIEHAFFVLSKGRKNIILEAGIGNNNQSVVDVAGVLKGVRTFNPDQVTMVHNHPSGRVKASREDMLLYKSLKNALGDKLQQGIILNTDSGIYGTFDENLSHQFEFGEDYETPNKMVDIPVFSFDTLVFKKNDPDKNWQLRSPEEIATFLSTQRFGEKTKIGFLCMDPTLKVMGNFHLPYNGITKENINDIAENIVDASLSVNANQCIIYGKGKNLGIINEINAISKSIKKQSASSINLLDAIEIKDNKSLYISASEEGIIPIHSVYSPQENYRTRKFESIDIIRTSDGGGMIRVKKDGEYLPAEKLRKTDLDRMEKGSLKKEEIANLYFKDKEVNQAVKVKGIRI